MVVVAAVVVVQSTKDLRIPIGWRKSSKLAGSLPLRCWETMASSTSSIFFFQYLLKPKSSSTVSSSVRNQTTTGRDHESSPRAKRQPFSNKVRLLMRLNSNWPAERELSSSTAFTSTLFCFQNWNITEEETKKKRQYIIAPLIICAYSICKNLAV